MKKLAFISAVVLTTLTLQSCRQSDDYISPQEAATLKRVQDSSNNLVDKNTTNISTTIIDNNQNNNTSTLVDGEIVPPPKK